MYGIFYLQIIGCIHNMSFNYINILKIYLITFTSPTSDSYAISVLKNIMSSSGDYIEQLVGKSLTCFLKNDCILW
jgi:hypothetical protein